MVPFFYVCALVAVLAALNVVFQRTPVYSALSLIVVLCALAGIYLQLGGEFLAVIQVIVYAGAIMVLFTLVIMLLNAHKEEPTHKSRIAGWLGIPALAILLGEILLIMYKQFPVATTRAAAAFDAGPAAIGHLLFQTYALPFEVTSILILVAILGAVTLAKKQL